MSSDLLQDWRFDPTCSDRETHGRSSPRQQRRRPATTTYLWRSARERSGVTHSIDLIGSLEDGAQQARRLPIRSLLDQLSVRHQIQWNDVAKVAGVSRQAIHKWRNDSIPDPKRLRSLCYLLAFCDEVKRRGGDPAVWIQRELEVRGQSTTLTVADVLAAGYFQYSLRHFVNKLDDRELVERAFPQFSSEPASLTEIYLDGSVFVGSIPKLGLAAQAVSMVELREDLREQVVDYIEDWHTELRRYEPHLSRAELVISLEQAANQGRLDKILYGR